MKELQKELKNLDFRSMYLLFGEERYLVLLYEKKLKEAIVEPSMEMMNLDVFDGKEIDVGQIIDAISTLPFLQDNRLVIIRDSGLFAAGRKDDTERLAKAVSDMPKSTILIFNEPQVDKRNKLYKKVGEYGRAVEFTTPTEKELTDWIIRSFKQEGKSISVKNAGLMIKSLDRNMQLILGECEKLISYKGNEKEISESDIEFVCTKTLETKIFDMIGAICNKRPEIALDIFANLILLKESPIMVISLMARQFRLILQSKFLAEGGMTDSEIASRLGQRGFIIKECLKQAPNFTVAELKQALIDCLEADINIKTGKLNDRLAVEMLIIKYTV